MRKILFYTLFLLCTFSAGAQRKQIRFDNIDINNGLSQSSVNDIIQDEKGFIWIATQGGLNKYDGENFTIFKKDPKDNQSLSNNFINAIYDDKKGNIWIGTNGGGINKFDKHTQKFTRYNTGEQNRIVLDVEGGNEGIIWYACSGGGLNSLDPKTGKSQNYLNQGMDAKNVQIIFFTSKNEMLVGTAGNGLYRYDQKNKTFSNIEHPLVDDVIWSLAEDNNGQIWVGTNDGLLRMRPVGNGKYEIKKFTHTKERFSLSNNTVRYVYVTNKNMLLVGITDGGFDMMDIEAGNEKFYNYSHNEFINYSLSDNLVQCLFEDKTGSIWIGTNNGVSHFDPLKQVFDHITSERDNPNSLNDRNVWCIYEDKEGFLWVGTRQGLNRVDRRNNVVNRYNHTGSNKNTLNNNSVMSVYVDKDKTVWVGAVDGLYKLKTTNDFRTASFVPVPFRRGNNAFSDNRIYRIFEDADGFLWVGSKEGLSRIEKKSGEYLFFQNIPEDKSSLPANTVRFIFQDKKGEIWIACDGAGLVKVVSEKKNEQERVSFKSYEKELKTESEDADLLVTAIWEEADGKFWLSTYGNGLILFDPVSGRVKKTYTEKDGLSNNGIYGITGDGKGNLWMTTNHGLNKFNEQTKKFHVYLEKDGLQSNEFNIGAVYRSASGELFFGGINGLNAFYPDQLKINTIPPEVVITDVLLFNKSLEIGGDNKLKEHVSYTKEITLSYRENSITIDFAALHFSNPSNNQYRYIMEGLEDEYFESGTLSKAFFNKIPHGTYTFKVYASNSDDVWSKEPATLIIHIQPPFWHTWWFRITMGILLLGGFIGFNKWRIYSINKQRLNLAKQVRERTREVVEQSAKIEQQRAIIEEEKNKVEKLLLNILPEETAEELKSRGKASARSYRQVTVMFTDFVGFTRIAEKMRPAELVAKLDSYFIKFDEIIQKHAIEKIKTIGDSYMCAGGVPIRSKSNPIDTVLAALEIQRYMNELKVNSSEGEDNWELRIGINTGEIIAGVIGTKRFAYDIWGNTVNTANRLQITSEPGMINVSGTTFQEIEPYFEFSYRGKIAAKNKGEIDMYYVHRIKPELSVDWKGIEPNETFWKYADLYLYSSINYKKAERHIMKILKERLPSHLHYHGIHHTLDVVQAAERIALMEGITDDKIFVLKSAATYHDAGFVEQYDKNEPVGIRMAEEILPKYGYTPEQVEDVAKLINATIIPHNPQTLLQQIICDADLDYLGRDDFHEIADTLRRELREAGKINSDRGWDEMQVKFLNMHKYFTKSAISLRQAIKEKHIGEIMKRLEENNYKD